MLKKAIVTAAAVAVASGFVFGTDVFSYVSTGADNVRQAVKSEVPIEFELDRARTLVKDLDPEIKKSLHVIAEEQVAVEKLEKAIAKRESRIAEQEMAIRRLRDDVKSEKTLFVYAGRTYDKPEVTKELADRFDRFEVAEDTLKRERQVLDAKEKNLAAHRDQLDAMMAARKDLVVEIEQLEARLNSVRAAESLSELEIDDSALTRARSLISDLNTKLDVRERLLDETGTLIGGIPVEQEVESIPVDLVDRVDARFGSDTEDVTKLAANE